MKPKLLLLFALCIFSLKGLSQTTLFKKGPVWELTMIEVEPEYGKEYLENIMQTYMPVMDMAKQEKIILDYKILKGFNANPNDWNFMLLIELPDMATLDGLDTKLNEIRDKLLKEKHGDYDAVLHERSKLRKVWGVKIMTELELIK